LRNNRFGGDSAGGPAFVVTIALLLASSDEDRVPGIVIIAIELAGAPVPPPRFCAENAALELPAISARASAKMKAGEIVFMISPILVPETVAQV
jgi:hypothetical protein